MVNLRYADNNTDEFNQYLLQYKEKKRWGKNVNSIYLDICQEDICDFEIFVEFIIANKGSFYI